MSKDDRIRAHQEAENPRVGKKAVSLTVASPCVSSPAVGEWSAGRPTHPSEARTSCGIWVLPQFVTYTRSGGPPGLPPQ